MTDQEVFAGIKNYFNEFPYNGLLGIEIEHICTQKAVIALPMEHKLIGNHLQKILHGGAIASVLDVAAAAMAMTRMFHHRRPSNFSEFEGNIRNLATIDMRVDFLRPGTSSRFVATARVLRQGSKLGVIRADLCNEDGQLVAAGTLTYWVG